jgi:hypothetical protein
MVAIMSSSLIQVNTHKKAVVRLLSYGKDDFFDKVSGHNWQGAHNAALASATKKGDTVNVVKKPAFA